MTLQKSLLRIVLGLSFCIVGPLSAQDLSPLKIGGLYSLIGYGAIGGIAEMNAAKMAIEEINRAGGIAGHPIELLVEDTRSETKTTALAFNKLTKIDKVSLVLGPNWGEFAEVVAPMAEREQVIMITPSGYTESLNQNRRFVFSMVPSHRAATLPAFNYIKQNQLKKIIVLVSNNAYFESMQRAFTDLLAEAGSTTIELFTFNQADLDFRSTLSRIKKTQPDLLVSFLMEGATASFVKQAKEQKFDFGKILYATGLPYDDVILKNKALANGITFFDYFDSGSPEFRARYFEKYKTESQLGTSKSYDSVYVLKQAIEQCGLENEQILKCLRSKEYQGVSGRIKFDENGRFIGDSEITKLYRVTDGAFVALE